MNYKTYQCLAGALMFLLMGLFYSCKKDLGNYEYTDTAVPKLDTTGMPASIAVERYGTLTLNPGINFNPADTGRLNYEWRLYKVSSGSTTEIPVVKVIGRTRKLSAAIGEPIGSYQVELIVTDTRNDLKSNVVFNLAVTANINIEYGVLVLHSRNDISDVDFLLTRNAVPMAAADRWVKQIYSQSQGMGLPGEAKFIVQARRSFTTQNWITIGSSTQLTRVNGTDFSFIRENASLFLRTGEVINPQAYVFSSGSNNELIINNGRLHFINSSDVLAAVFPSPATGDYALAPFIADASGSSIIGAVYDTRRLKFMHPVSTNVMVDFRTPAAGTQPFDLTNIGKTIIGMDRGFSGQTLSFFKDQTGNGRWLYVTNFNKADDGLMAVGRYDMTALPDIANATIFRSIEYGYAAYYATAHDVYLYDYAGTNTAKKAFSVAAAETITCMKVFKPKPVSNLETTDGRLLYVATWDGTTGRVYELRINAVSGEIEPVVLNKFEGFGRVVDITAKARGNGTL